MWFNKQALSFRRKMLAPSSG